MRLSRDSAERRSPDLCALLEVVEWAGARTGLRETIRGRSHFVSRKRQRAAGARTRRGHSPRIENGASAWPDSLTPRSRAASPGAGVRMNARICVIKARCRVA